MLELRPRPSLELAGSPPLSLSPPLAPPPLLATATEHHITSGADVARVDKGKARAVDSDGDASIERVLLSPSPPKLQGVLGPSCAVAGPSCAVTGPSRAVAGPSCAATGPSRAVTGPSQAKRGKPSVSTHVPRYATQMPPIFTQQNAREEELQEERRQQDLQRVRAVQREKNTVIVYAWSKVRSCLLHLMTGVDVAYHLGLCRTHHLRVPGRIQAAELFLQS